MSYGGRPRLDTRCNTRRAPVNQASGSASVGDESALLLFVFVRTEIDEDAVGLEQRTNLLEDLAVAVEVDFAVHEGIVGDLLRLALVLRQGFAESKSKGNKPAEKVSTCADKSVPLQANDASSSDSIDSMTPR